MDVHVRKNRYFVQNEAWNKASERYESFMTRYADRGKVVLMELGIGFNTPTIIRYPFERITYMNENATLVRLNAEYPEGPDETAARTIPFSENMNFVVDNLLKYIL